MLRPPPSSGHHDADHSGDHHHGSVRHDHDAPRPTTTTRRRPLHRPRRCRGPCPPRGAGRLHGLDPAGAVVRRVARRVDRGQERQARQRRLRHRSERVRGRRRQRARHPALLQVGRGEVPERRRDQPWRSAPASSAASCSTTGSPRQPTWREVANGSADAQHRHRGQQAEGLPAQGVPHHLARARERHRRLGRSGRRRPTTSRCTATSSQAALAGRHQRRLRHELHGLRRLVDDARRRSTRATTYVDWIAYDPYGSRASTTTWPSWSTPDNKGRGRASTAGPRRGAGQADHVGRVGLGPEGLRHPAGVLDTGPSILQSRFPMLKALCTGTARTTRMPASTRRAPRASPTARPTRVRRQPVLQLDLDRRRAVAFDDRALPAARPPAPIGGPGRSPVAGYTGPMSAAPLLVTGLPRSGTSWTGKMLEASGQVVYVNEPMNTRRPPGRSPGVLNAHVQHRFQYVDPADDAVVGRRVRRHPAAALPSAGRTAIGADTPTTSPAASSTRRSSPSARCAIAGPCSTTPTHCSPHAG